MNNREKSRKIAISSIGASISLIFVILSYYIKNISISLNIMASIGLMMPLSQKYYKESILSYVAVSILGSFFVNINILSFVLLGGLFPIIVILFNDYKQKKYVKIITYFIFSLITFFIFYKILGAFMINLKEIFTSQSLIKLYVITNIIYFAALLVYELILLMLYREVKRLILRVKG